MEEKTPLSGKKRPPYHGRKDPPIMEEKTPIGQKKHPLWSFIKFESLELWMNG
jgi:hypothetical protein